MKSLAEVMVLGLKALLKEWQLIEPKTQWQSDLLKANIERLKELIAGLEN